MQNRLQFIGVTGGVGAGKSTVLSYLKEQYGARIMLSDEIAKDLSSPGGSAYEEIRRAFPDPGLYLEDGTMDRKAFAELVFSDKEKRSILNHIVHPAVKRYIIGEYEKEKREGTCSLLILEAALLIEEHYDEICDSLWYVYASEETRRRRLRENRGYSDEKIDGIFRSQLPEKMYRHYCEGVIDNNGTEEAMKRSVDQLLLPEGITPVPERQRDR